jgi:hypothetical protein
MPFEFKFVVDGDLDDGAQAVIAKAVGEAGSRALVDAREPRREALEIDVSRIRDWGWIGRAVLLDARAVQIAAQLKDIVQL